MIHADFESIFSTIWNNNNLWYQKELKEKQT